MGNERFPALTGIRAFAAFLVFFHHLPLHTGVRFITGLQLGFYWGVTLFFVLSGFLITWHYYKNASLSGSWLAKYFTNRLARIYPVYFLVLTIVIILLRKTDAIFLLQNYTLTHHLFFLFRTHGMAITPSWSLTVEECFYLLAPLIFLLTRKFNIWVPLLLTACLLGIILIFYEDGSLVNTVFPVFFGTFFGNFIAFFAGIFLALGMLKQENAPTPQHMNKKWTITGIAGIIVVSVLLGFATDKEITEKYILMIIGNNILLPFAVISFFYGLIMENSFWKRLLSTNAMRLFGRSSYVFYLVHLPLIEFFGAPYIQHRFREHWYNLYVLLMFALTLFLSVFLFLAYEHPVNGWLRKLFRASSSAR